MFLVSQSVDEVKRIMKILHNDSSRFGPPLSLSKTNTQVFHKEKLPNISLLFAVRGRNLVENVSEFT